MGMDHNDSRLDLAHTGRHRHVRECAKCDSDVVHRRYSCCNRPVFMAFRCALATGDPCGPASCVMKLTATYHAGYKGGEIKGMPFCSQCGNKVKTPYCPSCGARTGVTDGAALDPQLEPARDARNASVQTQGPGTDRFRTGLEPDRSTAQSRRSWWDYYFEAFKKYAVFSGRATRSEYWFFFLFNVLVGFGIGVVGGFVGGFSGLNEQAVETATDIPLALFMIVTLVPSIAVSARRLHDIGLSGLWLLLYFVPFLGGIAMLCIFCADSQPGPNRFGPNPKGVSPPLDQTEATAKTV